MRLSVVALTTVLGLSTLPLAGQKPAEKSVRLESMAWPEAEKALTPETVVVIPARCRDVTVVLPRGNCRRPIFVRLASAG